MICHSTHRIVPDELVQGFSDARSRIRYNTTRKTQSPTINQGGSADDANPALIVLPPLSSTNTCGSMSNEENLYDLYGNPLLFERWGQ